VGDDRPEVDQNPAAVGVPLGARHVEAGVASFLNDRVCDGSRLDFRTAGRDDESIGHDRTAFERQG